jgi:hypothetical protein
MSTHLTVELNDKKFLPLTSNRVASDPLLVCIKEGNNPVI